jgi:uncharacterized protein
MRPDILTIAGKYFNFLEPERNEFGIHEIAHALSLLCRFTGHTPTMYSVAQHSVAVSYLVPREHALVGLLHDAAEAFMGDVSAPLKQLLPEYKAIEKRVQAAIYMRFGIDPIEPPCVKKADLIMLATEQRDLMPAHDDVWEWEGIEGIEPMKRRVVPWSSEEAAYVFLRRFQNLQMAAALELA